MARMTLREMIDFVDECQEGDGKYLDVILAAAKAFACETCGGTGRILVAIADTRIDCPACAEYRRIAKEGVGV